jgi:hypothetical protein
MKDQPKGKALEPKWGHCMAVDWHRKFKARERLAILLGFQFQVKCRVFMMHKPGQIQPIFAGEITQWATPQAQSAADDHGQLVPPEAGKSRWSRFKRAFKKKAVELAWRLVREKRGKSPVPDSLKN